MLNCTAWVNKYLNLFHWVSFPYHNINKIKILLIVAEHNLLVIPETAIWSPFWLIWTFQSTADHRLIYFWFELSNVCHCLCENIHLCSSLHKLLTPRRELMRGRIDREAGSQGKEQKHNNKLMVRTPREDGEHVTLCGWLVLDWVSDGKRLS